MGQYYHTVFLEPDKKTPFTYACAHKVGCGIKLMEHSYINNALMNAALNYMWKNRDSQDFQIVWAGDYADPEQENDRTLYEMCEGLQEIPYETEHAPVRFIVNHDKKQYIDLWNCPNFTCMRAHPLALLTAEGNGRGGGDYAGTNMNLVGTWARDSLNVMDGDWNNEEKLHSDGYTELKPDFIEDYELLRTFLKSCDALTKNLNAGGSRMMDFEADRIREQVKELKAALPKKIYQRKR